MLVNPEHKQNKVSETVVAVRMSQADACLLDVLVNDAKSRGLVKSKSAFIRFVLSDYVNRHADVLEVTQ